MSSDSSALMSFCSSSCERSCRASIDTPLPEECPRTKHALRARAGHAQHPLLRVAAASCCSSGSTALAITETRSFLCSRSAIVCSEVPSARIAASSSAGFSPPPLQCAGHVFGDAERRAMPRWSTHPPRTGLSSRENPHPHSASRCAPASSRCAGARWLAERDRTARFQQPFPTPRELRLQCRNLILEAVTFSLYAFVTSAIAWPHLTAPSRQVTRQSTSGIFLPRRRQRGHSLRKVKTAQPGGQEKKVGSVAPGKGAELRATTSRAVEEPAVGAVPHVGANTPAPKHLGLGNVPGSRARVGAAVVSDAGCRARGSGWGRPDACVCRGLCTPRTSRRLSTPRRSHCATETCPCAGWVSIPRGSSACVPPSWARWRRCGACPWRSCTSGVQCMAQLAAMLQPEGGAAKGRARGHKGTPTGTGAPACDLLPRRGQRAAGRSVQCECCGVGGAASPWLDAGRVHWRLQGECRAGTRNETRGMGARPDRVHAAREGGWWRGAGWATCSCEGRCVWAWQGCREAEKRTPPRAVVASGCSSPTPRAGNPCVCATQPGAGCGVCTARQGLGAGGAGEKEPPRDAVLEAVSAGCPSPSVCVRPPGWRRARLGAKEMRRRSPHRKFGGRGVTSGRKSSNWSSKAKPTKPEACVSTGARVPREARLPRAARAPGQKKKRKKAAARRAPTAEEAHRMHARKNHALQKRHAAPRARAGGHAARSSDCGGEAGGGLGEMGRGAGEARRDVDRLTSRGTRRAERRGAAVPTSRDTFPPFPVNGCRSDHGLVGWRAAASSG